MGGGGGGGGGGAYARDKNTSAGLCAKNAGGGGLCARGGRICGTLRYLQCYCYSYFAAHKLLLPVSIDNRDSIWIGNAYTQCIA